MRFYFTKKGVDAATYTLKTPDKEEIKKYGTIKTSSKYQDFKF